MFKGAKRTEVKQKQGNQYERSHEPSIHGRAASVPHLPPVARFTPNVATLQAHQGRTPTPWPQGQHHPQVPPPLPVRSRGHGSSAGLSCGNRIPEWGQGAISRIASQDAFNELGQRLGCGDRLPDLIGSKLDSVLSAIDGETFSGNERELDIYEPLQLRGGWGSATREVSKGADRAISKALVRSNVFAKANLYANSRLPNNLPDLKLYLPSYPLICLAAQYSQRVYTKATGKEREVFVDSSWRMGTKAMVLKSVPIDDMNTVVFAIRGSQTFMDWAVNLKSAPASPEGFLNDPGNLCHAGFLHVARNMVPSVAARLRSLLEEDPSRSGCSLLMTGHSAGGAVATLLYAHMLCEDLRSELSVLTGCFKRIHCITFGTPPISLLPLQKPSEPRLRKSLFLSFINEGDPVPRADRAYVRSLLDLYASPAPPLPSPPSPLTGANQGAGAACTFGKIVAGQRPLFKRRGSAPAALPPAPISAPSHQQQVPVQSAWIWEVPPGTLSNAGRLVVLRTPPSRPGKNGSSTASDNEDNVKASVTTDEDLRAVVFGDPVCHMMKMYARRVEVLATRAVTASGWS